MLDKVRNEMGGIDLQDELVVDEAASSEDAAEAGAEDESSDDEDRIALEHPTWIELPAPEPTWLAERWKQLRGSGPGRRVISRASP
jgi:hypothetical protein